MTQFLISIPVALLLWVAASQLRSTRGRQLLLLAASYLFYSSWGVGFLSVLIASSLMNYAVGRLLRRRLSLGALWFGIALNLLPLCFFKYLPALLEAGAAGSWQYALAHGIAMPVGMSFWTFQALSYLFDIYLEEEIDPSLTEFCLYMAFWPTVISGPVCRLPKMLPQFRKKPVLSTTNISSGGLLVLQGLVMKMCLAQVMEAGWKPGSGVAAGFAQAGGWGGVDVWLLSMGFGFVMFFDFAGYSLMAIGAARLFGVELAENFDRPFLSVTPTDFWKRWHMSLSFWIRDYLYTPLAAAGRTRTWTYFVLLFSMIVFGLWHGPKWTFVLFGFYHGALLVLHRLGQQAKRRWSIRLPYGLGKPLAWVATFLAVSLGFIFFRADNVGKAVSMWETAFSPAAYGHFAMPRSFYGLTGLIVLGYFGFHAGHS